MPEATIDKATVLEVRPVPGGVTLDQWRANLAGALAEQPVRSVDALAEVVLRTDTGRILVLIRPRQTAPLPGTRVGITDVSGLE